MLETEAKPLTKTQIPRKQLEVEKIRNDERDLQYQRLELRMEDHIRSKSVLR
jgi:hypothetical protein